MVRASRLHAMEAEDVAVVGADFRSGAVGTIVATTAAHPGGAESIAVHGTGGSARLSTDTLEIVPREGPARTIGEGGGSGGGADPMAFTHAWHQAVIEDFADAVRGERPPLVTGRDALRVHALIDAILRSSEGARAVDLGDA